MLNIVVMNALTPRCFWMVKPVSTPAVRDQYQNAIKAGSVISTAIEVRTKSLKQYYTRNWAINAFVVVSVIGCI